MWDQHMVYIWQNEEWSHIMGILIGHRFKHKDPKLARNGFICTTVPISIYWLITAFPMKIAMTGGIPGVQTHFFHLPMRPQLLGFSLVSCIQHRKAPAKKMHFWRWCAVHDRKCIIVVTSSEMFGYLFYSVSWHFNGILMCFEGDSMPIPLYVISVLAESPNATDS